MDETASWDITKLANAHSGNMQIQAPKQVRANTNGLTRASKCLWSHTLFAFGQMTNPT